MKITNLHSFLLTYFQANQCEILENQDGLLKVKLTENLDKILMNRPFYWHYMKSIGQKGEPMTLSLNTKPEQHQDQGEWVHFGSPRLHTIFKHLKDEHSFTRLFQKLKVTQHTPLYPWLLINVKISYQGKQKKEEVYSLGLQLINGVMKVGMMEVLESLELSPVISDYCYPLSPIITLKSGYRRIESVLDAYIESQHHQWATDALAALEEEQQLLKYFYQDRDQAEQEPFEKEMKALSERYTPRIFFEVINGGLIYLTDAVQHMDPPH